MDFKNKQHLHEYSTKLIGKPFKYIDSSGEILTTRNKGYMGQKIETNFLGKKLDSAQEPDLLLLDGTKVEVKVTPAKQLKNGEYRSKEKLVLTLINYLEGFELTFRDSHVYSKLKNTYLYFYLYEENISAEFYRFIQTKFLFIEYNDMQIIKNDYKIITDKIKSGMAHTLGESDTIYLAASVKGGANTPLRKQKYSAINAKQRSYCLKSLFMSKILNSDLNINKEMEETIDPRNKIIEILMKYKGIDREILKQELKLTTNAKNINNIIIKNLLAKEKLLDYIELSSIDYRTIPLKKLKNGQLRVKEALKLYSMKTCDFYCSWEDTDFFEYLDSKVQIFIYFLDNKIYDIKLYNFDYNTKRFFEKTYLFCKDIYLYGFNNRHFPKITESSIGHVRPGAKDGNDKDITRTGEYFTKQSYWLNQEYLLKYLLA